jgi:hypothetical protein
MGKQMNSNNPNSTAEPLRLQLLVDGKLDHTQRSQWLDSLAKDSDQWRQIALRFVENQILDEALQPDALLATKPPYTKTTNDRQGPEQRRSLPANVFWLAVAGSLLVGLLLGTLIPDGADRPEIAKTVVTEPVVHSDVESMDSGSIGRTDTVLNLPLADALARSATPVSINARRAFLKAGYYVDESQQIATVELPTGKSIQMPIRQVTVRYLGQNAYQ